MIFHQLFEPESSTYTYLLADENSREAILIDPVRETVERDLKLIADLKLKLKYILETHVHADHVTGASILRRRTGAQTALSAKSQVECADKLLKDGDELTFGKMKLFVLATPGHTDSCLSYYIPGFVFSGDTLLIGGTGRTDFQQGDSRALFRSVREKLFKLPPATDVFPAHDYKGLKKSTIAHEMEHNPRVGIKKSEDEFVQIMKELDLAYPKQIDKSLPANQKCGDLKMFPVENNNGIPEVTPENLKNHLGQVRLIDCRRPDEFNAELGHIAGAELVTLGPDLQKFLQEGDREQSIVFVCRSGGRSGQATAFSQNLGYKNTVNMQGGMLRWNELGFPVEKK